VDPVEQRAVPRIDAVDVLPDGLIATVAVI
jgi:hypothetical protein